MSPTTAAERALARIEDLLDTRVPGWAESGALARAAQEMSTRYTAMQDVHGDDVASWAYLAYFGPRAIAAGAAALQSAGLHLGGAVVVDVGCGSGASALLLACAGARQIVGVDVSAPALAIARALVGDALRPVCSTVAAAPPARDAALVFSSFAFAEIPGAPAEAFDALARLGPDRPALLVDAGDRPHARRLQELREALRAAGAGRRVLGPCPHDDACPALVRARDWCHTRAPRNLPPRLAAFARAVGRDDDAMAYAWLHISAPGATPTSETGVLVIGEPLKEKGRARLPVCGPGGVRFVQALKRDRSAFDALLAVPRGARLPPAIARAAEGQTAHVVDPAALEPASER